MRVFDCSENREEFVLYHTKKRCVWIKFKIRTCSLLHVYLFCVKMKLKERGANLLLTQCQQSLKTDFCRLPRQTVCAVTVCCGFTTHYSAFLPLTDVDPASVQAFHGDVEPLSLLTEPVGHWHGAVFEYHRSSRLRIPTHLEDRRTRKQADRELLLPPSGRQRN